MGDIGSCNFDGGVKIVEDMSKVFIVGGREGLVRIDDPVDELLLEDNPVKTFDQHINKILFLWLFGVEL